MTHLYQNDTAEKYNISPSIDQSVRTIVGRGSSDRLRKKLDEGFNVGKYNLSYDSEISMYVVRHKGHKLASSPTMEIAVLMVKAICHVPDFSINAFQAVVKDFGRYDADCCFYENVMSSSNGTYSMVAEDRYQDTVIKRDKAQAEIQRIRNAVNLLCFDK